MEKRHACRFLDMGSWVSAAPGTALVEEDQPVPHLVYLARGTAEVVSNGKVVASLGDKHFIGEMTVLSGDPATATVVLSESSRYLAIQATSLRALLGRSAVIRRELETCLAAQMKMKLVAANKTAFEFGQVQCAHSCNLTDDARQTMRSIAWTDAK